MAQCAYCKAETYLYDGGVPICIPCSVAQESKRKPLNVRTILDQELLAATERAKAASASFDSVVTMIPSGIPHPDGTQRIINASHEVSAARIEMLKAHNRLNDFLENGAVPEDLKRSGVR